MDKNFFSDLTGIIGKLAPVQKMILAGVAVITTILLIVLVSIMNEPKYTTLYSNLSSDDASRVVEKLSSDKVPYEIDGGGSVIKVPDENVYELRLQFAAKGIPNSGIVGYEIFDKNTIGMSEFMQKLNFRRALEGELSRTIIQQDEIEAARVHIVFPKKAVFKEDEVVPTSSVVVKQRANHSLTKENILAIQNLVAGSVEGLTNENVTILDTKGNLLSVKQNKESFAFESSSQYELKKSVELYLKNKAQEMMDNILGQGNAVVQIDALLNFDKAKKTMELYDPDFQVARAEQTTKNSNFGKNLADSSANVSENSTINYEINKTIETVIASSGGINKLTFAAVINYQNVEVKNGEETKVIQQPIPDEELMKLEGILKNAIGYDDARGDSFSLENIPFNQTTNEEFVVPETEDAGFFDSKNIDKLINLIIVIIGIISSLLIVRGLLTKVKEEKIQIGTSDYDGNLALAGGGAITSELQAAKAQMGQVAEHKKDLILPSGNLEDDISDEAALKKVQHERLTNYVSQNPMDAAKLINAWLHEDDNS